MNRIDAKTAMEELSMMLIYLSHFTERDRMADPDSKYAWKGYDFDVLNKLDEKDYIRQGSHRSKSMYITKEGEAKAKELMESITWQIGKIMSIISITVYRHKLPIIKCR